MVLVLRIRNFSDGPVPTLSTVFAFVPLFLGRAALVVLNHGAGPWPEAHGPLVYHE